MSRPAVQMEPTTGERLVRFVGDRLRFTLRPLEARALPADLQAFLRTNLGRADVLREEIVQAAGGARLVPGASWRDVPMRREGGGWAVDFTLTEVGYFSAKAYAVDAQGFQTWPPGPDVGVTVHPDCYRTANTIYCAFPRLFGKGKGLVSTGAAKPEARWQVLDKQGYTLIPPSGKLRDVTRALPHVVETLGCRILHLLPVTPTPTTYVRLGRFGSPYAGLDLTAIDPALIEFDRRTTGVEQFCELAYAVHARRARLILDLVINHTGWSSTLHEQHPEWFLRQADGTFKSPGAWGVTWEDLVEVDERHPALWETLAEAFLTWCRRGVDGFRCDAGYQVPMPVWRHLIARIRAEFPETLFLLEGLGGAWADTELLLTEGGMQWAYSELFQEVAGFQVAGYLDHAIKQSRGVGLLVHYSETHDNDRLAAKGRAWSLLRNRLCALASASGGYGFTCGVEWLATEKIQVHGCSALAWGNQDNLLPELARLNRLLATHPCFFDGATMTRLSSNDSPVLALRRDSATGQDQVLVLVNTDPEEPHDLSLDAAALAWLDRVSAQGVARTGRAVDLLGQPPPAALRTASSVRFSLAPGACYCLARSAEPSGLSGEAYRLAHARVALLVAVLRKRFDPEEIGPYNVLALAGVLERDPLACLGALDHLDPELVRRDPVAAFAAAVASAPFPAVVPWELIDRRRVTPVPPGHWLLIKDPTPFRATLTAGDASLARHAESVPVREGHVAVFPPSPRPGHATLVLERYAESDRHVSAVVRFLAPGPDSIVLEASVSDQARSSAHPEDRFPITDHRLPPSALRPPHSGLRTPHSELVLLTNGRGGMARLAVDLGRITSKYDCLLGANLDPVLPADRHVLVKRTRVWADAHGFLSPLDADNLARFAPGPPAVWQFAANAGDGCTVGIELSVAMLRDRNTTVLRFRRLPGPAASSPGVRLTVRLDLEDRSFHAETRRNREAEAHFAGHLCPLADRTGFAFVPALSRELRVFSDCGVFHNEPEWSQDIPHPVEASRGQVASGDAWSPGWFDLPLPDGHTATVVVCADPDDPAPPEIEAGLRSGAVTVDSVLSSGSEGSRAGEPPSPGVGDRFGRLLAQAVEAFLVRRGEGQTVIAGYPWFLDWGRDTLICARGLLAAGRLDDVRELLVTFGGFEERGTLPNLLSGNTVSNRDTSDAPLWFALACDEFVAQPGRGAAPQSLYAVSVDPTGRSIANVLLSIATHYARGTPNGIRLDAESGLIWSPSHFTWMDTNYPAGTPREGYPIEIQALWIRLLRQLARMHAPALHEPWGTLADRAEASLLELFWLDDRGWLADCLVARAGQPARRAPRDTALRSNGLFAVSLGLLRGERARRCVEAARRYLLVPGAVRSLAPLPVSPPLAIHAADGRLLNDPNAPYWGRYKGDEDTQRKPAYHNGTAWVWMLPTFCEALVRAWESAPAALAAARAYLASTDRLLAEGCLGQLPELLDGDAPHTQRGCDAQAWSMTEVFRVWRWLAEHST